MRYDILYTIHMPNVGIIKLYFDDIRVHGLKIYMTGYDEDNNRIDLILDKLVYPKDRQDDCGYCHITSYTMHGKTVHCNYYKSIH